MEQILTAILVFAALAVAVAFVNPLGALRPLAVRLAIGLVLAYVGLTLLIQATAWVVGAIANFDARWMVVVAAAVVGIGAVAPRLRSRSRRPGEADVATRTHTRTLETGLDPFVGRDERGGLVTVTPEDSIGVVGPTRSGKTSGVLIPQALMWAGPMVSVSVRTDVLRATGNQRQRIAEAHGGSIYVFDPTESAKAELVELANGNWASVPTLRWSVISGCERPEVAKLRAQAMVWASSSGGASAGERSTNSHFERRAAMILRIMFHAAALSGKSIQDVLGWIDAHDYNAPADLIYDSESSERVGWYSELLGLEHLAPEERGSCFSTAANALDAFSMSVVQRNCAATDFDLEEFVRSKSVAAQLRCTTDMLKASSALAAVEKQLPRSSGARCSRPSSSLYHPTRSDDSES